MWHYFLDDTWFVTDRHTAQGDCMHCASMHRMVIKLQSFNIAVMPFIYSDNFEYHCCDGMNVLQDVQKKTAQSFAYTTFEPFITEMRCLHQNA